MANKLFKVVGISTFKGQRKVRYAQELKRIIALNKCGNTDIEMFELPYAMTKDEALKYALDNNLFTLDNVSKRLNKDAIIANIKQQATVSDVLAAVA